MTDIITGQQVLDAWQKTHESTDKDATQICLNAPIFLHDLLTQPFNLENQVKVEIQMWKYLSDAQIVGPLGATFNINRLEDVLLDPAELLAFHGTTKEQLILESIRAFPDLVEKHKADTLMVVDVLMTAPGVLFDNWNK